MIPIIIGFIVGILVYLFCSHSTDLTISSKKCERTFQTHLFHQESFYDNASYNIIEVLDSFFVTVEPINKDTSISITQIENSSTNINDTTMTDDDYSVASTIHHGHINLLLSLLSIDSNFILFPLLVAIQYVNYKYIHNYLFKLRSIEKVTVTNINDDEINGNTQASMNENEVDGINDKIYKEFFMITEAWEAEQSSIPLSLLLSTEKSEESSHESSHESSSESSLESSLESPLESSSESSSEPATPPVSFSKLESTSSLKNILQSPINKQNKVGTPCEDHPHMVSSKVGKLREDHTRDTRSYQSNKLNKHNHNYSYKRNSNNHNRFKILEYLSNE